MQNPYPLTYCKFVQELRVKKRNKRPSESHKLISGVATPTIPRKYQYADSFAGNTKDSVGPGQYNAQVDSIKNRRP
jgi:hypothetical protein